MIRAATQGDLEGIWPIFEEVVRPGDTYAIPTDATREDCQRMLLDQPEACFVAESEGAIEGLYYLKVNAGGHGDHVCNCGYMVASSARGKGTGRALAEHSLAEAKRRRYQAMQFNLVVATNLGAIRLWEDLGFQEVGRLPAAFRHPEQGLVDALVMWRDLADV